MLGAFGARRVLIRQNECPKACVERLQFRHGTPDEKDKPGGLLFPSKMNIEPDQHGLAYRIEGCLVAHDGIEIATSRRKSWWAGHLRCSHRKEQHAYRRT